MTKYLLLIVLAGIAWWLWRKSRVSDSSAQPPVPRAAEYMVKCSHCGVNQPISESILADGRYYCCAAHRRISESEGS